MRSVALVADLFREAASVIITSFYPLFLPTSRTLFSTPPSSKTPVGSSSILLLLSSLQSGDLLDSPIRRYV